MNTILRRLHLSKTLTASLALLVVPALAEPVRVVATIKPVHSIVSAVMNGVGEPHLIMRGASSPHDFSLRPSDASRLQDADIVFLIDYGLETSLVGPIATLADDARVVALAGAPGLVHRPLREGGHFEVHDHGDHGGHGAPDPHEHDEAHGTHDDPEGHHGDDHLDDTDDGHAWHHDEEAHEEHAAEHRGPVDLHVWLDPVNAAAMAKAVAAALTQADAVNAAAYRANADAFAGRLDELAGSIAADTAHLRGRPFIVFHDAYRHFEERFGLTAAGSAVVSADRSPGARRIAELRDKVSELGVPCVLAEPQFDGRVVDVIIAGSDARAGTVDPLGAALQSGPDLYFALLGDMAAAFGECLAPS